MSSIFLLLLINRMFAPQPLIVLDPGHGGSNLGAPTLNSKFHEKDLTLDTALRAARLLEKQGFEVRLTRYRDTYLTLRQRTDMAEGARCFVSVHYNTSKVHDRRGIEIFVPHDSAFSCHLDSENVAATMPVLKSSLKERSLMLARAIRAHMPGTVRVAEAWFDVFEGICAPSVLVELGFADHPDEGRKVLDPSYRQKLAEALASAMASACR